MAAKANSKTANAATNNNTITKANNVKLEKKDEKKDERPCRERFSIKSPRDYVRIKSGDDVGKKGMVISSATSWRKNVRGCKYYIQYDGEEERNIEDIILKETPEPEENLEKIGSEPHELEEKSKTNNIKLKKIDEKKLKEFTTDELLEELKKSLKYITDEVYDKEEPLEGSYESIVKANTRNITRALVKNLKTTDEKGCILKHSQFKNIIEAYTSTCKGKINKTLKEALLRNMALFASPDKNLLCTEDSGEEFKTLQNESHCKK